jgi:hypothetical protein
MRFILFGLLTLLIGVIVYLIVARSQRQWPFEALKLPASE